MRREKIFELPEVSITIEGRRYTAIEINMTEHKIKIKYPNCDGYTMLLSPKQWRKLKEDYPEFSL